MTESYQSPDQEDVPPMSGDAIIANPDLAWDTTVVVPKTPDEAWAGRYGIIPMGSVEDGLAGPLLPQRFDPVLPPHMRSLAVDAPEPRRLRIGDTVPDGKPGSVGTVVELDDERKTMVIDTQWPSKKGRPGLRYTWQLTVGPGMEDGTSLVTARTRMEHVTHKAIGKMWPAADRYAMRLVAEGVGRDDWAPEATPTLQRKIGAYAIGTAGRVMDRRRANRTPSE